MPARHAVPKSLDCCKLLCSDWPVLCLFNPRIACLSSSSSDVTSQKLVRLSFWRAGCVGCRAMCISDDASVRKAYMSTYPFYVCAIEPRIPVTCAGIRQEVRGLRKAGAEDTYQLSTLIALVSMFLTDDNRKWTGLFCSRCTLNSLSSCSWPRRTSNVDSDMICQF